MEGLLYYAVYRHASGSLILLTNGTALEQDIHVLTVSLEVFFRSLFITIFLQSCLF